MVPQTCPQATSLLGVHGRSPSSPQIAADRGGMGVAGRRREGHPVTSPPYLSPLRPVCVLCLRISTLDGRGHPVLLCVINRKYPSPDGLQRVVSGKGKPGHCSQCRGWFWLWPDSNNLCLPLVHHALGFTEHPPFSRLQAVSTPGRETNWAVLTPFFTWGIWSPERRVTWAQTSNLECMYLK